MSRADERKNAAFTLLEILSVVAILALIAGIAMPNFSGVQVREVRNQAQQMVSALELARQRAIVTGVPHRLFIDLDGASYWVEWLVGDSVAEGEEPPEPVPTSVDPLGLADVGPLDLSAPREAERSYHPLPGLAGRPAVLADSIEFASVETDVGSVDRGETFIRFERDGTTDATTIVLAHESGVAVALEVLPLADTVRIRDATL